MIDIKVQKPIKRIAEIINGLRNLAGDGERAKLEEHSVKK